MRTRLQKPKKMVIAKFSVLFENAKLYFSSWGKQGLIHDIRHFCPRFRIDGVKAMSCGGGKQVIKFANTSNRGRVLFIFSKGDDNFRLEKCTVRASTSFTSSLLAVRTSTVAAASKRKKMITYTYNLKASS